MEPSQDPQTPSDTTDDAASQTELPEMPKKTTNAESRTSAPLEAGISRSNSKNITTTSSPHASTALLSEVLSGKGTNEGTVASSTAEKENKYIAVMGVSGTGKTTFINHATGLELKVGSSLESCTSEILLARTTINGYPVTLIDTPGFDDTSRDDVDILETIARYLEASYKNKILLTGVIYLHKITDNRINRSSVSAFTILKKICGKDSFSNIVVATTMWDNLNDKKVGIEHEKLLGTRNDWWGDLVTGGASMARHDNGKESAHRIISGLLPKQKKPLQIQKELSLNMGVIGNTTVGEHVKKILEDMKRTYEGKMSILRNTIQDLEEKNKKLEVKNKEQQMEMKKLEERQIKLEQEKKSLESDKTKLVIDRDQLVADREELAKEKKEKETLEMETQSKIDMMNDAIANLSRKIGTLEAEKLEQSQVTLSENGWTKWTKYIFPRS